MLSLLLAFTIHLSVAIGSFLPVHRLFHLDFVIFFTLLVVLINFLSEIDQFLGRKPIVKYIVFHRTLAEVLVVDAKLLLELRRLQLLLALVMLVLILWLRCQF